MRRALILALVVLGAVPATALASAQVELRPAAGAAGSAVVLRGTGFPASKRVKVTVTGRAARRVRADGSGAFKLSLTAPRGHRTLSIVSRSGRRRVSNRFSVTSAPGAAAVLEVGSDGGQRVRVSPLTLLPGGTLTLRGTGFRARQRLQVAGLGASARFRADKSGRFSTSLVLPATLRSTGSSLSVTGSGVKLTLRLARATITAPPLTPPIIVTPAPVEPAVAPSSTAAPSISGTPQLGQTLVAAAGGWNGTAPIAVAYQWRRCDLQGAQCADIAGATGASYVAADADVAGTLRVVVSASNAGGAADATSAQTAPVTAPPRNTVLPVVGGTPQEGETLIAANDAWAGYPAVKTADKSYQWLRCSGSGRNCTPISGKTSKTYKVVSGDVAKTLAVRMTAKTTAGSATVDSLPTGSVTAAPPPAGVAALWHMDELSGTTMNDAAPGNHDGVLSSGVTPGTPGGALGNAFAFNGVNGNVRVPAADLNPGATNVTVTLYMKTGWLPPNTVEDWDLFKKSSYYKPGTNEGQPEIKMEYYPDGRASCGWAGADDLGNLTFYEIKNQGPVLNDNLWHKIECVKTATSVKPMVDGALVKSKDIVIGSISNADDIVIGSHAAGTEWFNGQIDEVSVAYG